MAGGESRWTVRGAVSLDMPIRRSRRRETMMNKREGYEAAMSGTEVMSEVHLHKVQPAWKKNALIDVETYLKWYAESIKSPDKFWV